MNAQDYASIAAQVARQTPELSALDMEIAAAQPGVDALQATVDTAQQGVDEAQIALDAVLSQPAVDGREPDAAAERAALSTAQVALQQSQEALYAPKAVVDDVKARANALRFAIARCWQEMDDSGLVVDTAAVTLEQDRAQMWDRIKAERDRRKTEGGYTAAGKWFHSDVFSRTQQIGLVMLGASIPANTPWKTMDGSFITMTQTLAQQVFGAAAAQDMATFAAAEAHRAAMLASADPMAYDFSGGWPAVFSA